jgi:DNA-binding response OmpR family regulator
MSMKEKKFLLIEDDQDHAELITDVLKEDNATDIKIEVILKKDGQEAMDYFQNGSIDCDGDDAVKSEISLVILDLNLPKIDGMEVLKFIKKNSKYSSIPVIILSTSPDQKTIDEAYKNGANGYFVKPSTYDDFVEKIKILKKCC